MSDIFQLVYASTSTSQFKFDTDIDAILNVAREFNQSHDITGMLLFRDGVFLQLLEGPQKNVEDLYLKISKDIRHKNSTIVFQQKGNERIFPEWTMGYKNLGDFTSETFNMVLDVSNKIFTLYNDRKNVPNELIVKIFKAFRYKNTKENSAA